MKAADEQRVTIVGAGIIGICCALALLEKNIRVRIVDKAEPGQATSYGNAGVISPWSSVPQSLPGIWKEMPKWLLDPSGPVSVNPNYLFRLAPWALRFFRSGQAHRVSPISRAMDALVRPNVSLYRHHLNGTGHEHLLVESCYLQAFRHTKSADLSGISWRLRESHGAPFELIDGDQLREIEPALSPDFKGAVMIKHQARTVSPGQLGRVLAEKVQRLGGEFVSTSIQSIAPSDDNIWRLTTSDGELRAAQLVIAAGAWSTKLLRPLGLQLPLEAERGYHLMFKNPGVELSHSIMDMDRMIVTSSMQGGVRTAGTAEFAGLDAAPNYRRAKILSALSQQMLPKLNTADTTEWMGNRPSMPDSLPCIGEIAGHRGLFAAFGHSHFGLGMAPQTGQLIADIVSGVGTSTDMAPYSTSRFDRDGAKAG